MTEQRFDYIVVGAGSAGCALASRLAERGSVLLLEAGLDHRDEAIAPAIQDPATILGLIFAMPEVSVPYLTAPQGGLAQPDAATAGRAVGIHRGMVLGGCSSVNGMVWVRGNRRNYDHWAELGNPGWGYADVLPYFKRAENCGDGDPGFHGVDGPVEVRLKPHPSPAALAFVEAANSGRFPDSRPDWDFNGVRQEDAAGLYQMSLTAAGHRMSTATAYLGERRSSLEVRTGMRASRVLIEGGRAVGVEAIGGDGTAHRFQADAEVILSAGTFESPKLLMLSGIGPASHLQDHGIPVVVDLPGVGANLHDHMQILLYAKAVDGAEPGTSDFIAEAGLFTTTRGGPDAAPDLQYHVLAGMYGLPVDPVTDPNFLIVPGVIQPESRGSLRLRSGEPADPPVVDPGYLEAFEDVETLMAGVELAVELCTTPPLKGLCGGRPPFAMVADPAGIDQPPIRLDVPAAGRAGLERFVRSTATTVWHPVGTCKMGVDELAVVDPELRVSGVEGLRVADASIMPRITSGNTNAPAVMIGEKAADLL